MIARQPVDDTKRDKRFAPYQLRIVCCRGALLTLVGKGFI